MADMSNENIPVTQRHADYEKWVDTWERCRAGVEGQDAVKERGEKDLPRLADETPDEYDARRSMAVVYEAPARTLEAWLGALFRKSTTLTIDKTMEPHLENIDLSDTPYEGLRQTIAEEILTVRRYGVLVSWSEQMKRPFWRAYRTEDITNWSEIVIGGHRIVDQIVLRESVSQRSQSGIGSESKELYRLLEMQDGVFQVREVEPMKGSEGIDGRPTKFQATSEPIIPRVNGEPWREIPFATFGRLDLGPCPGKPPILPIINLMLDHYRLDADVKNAIHVSCNPTLVVIGDDREGKVYHVGSRRGLQLPQGASAMWLEAAGTGIDQAKQEKLVDENRMALLGARLLIAPKREAETAESLSIQREGENASLSTYAYMMTLGLTRCWRYHAMWMGLNPAGMGDELSRDFTPSKLGTEEVAALLQMVQAGKISDETFLDLLWEGEWLPHDAETERERIEVEGPKDAGDGDELMDDEDKKDEEDEEQPEEAA